MGALIHINFDEARKRASEAAGNILRGLLPPTCRYFLSEYYLEADGCWYFFPLDGLKNPPTPQDGIAPLPFAVAVSKVSGEVTMAYDFRGNEQKMKQYLEVFSLYQLGKRREAQVAWDAFIKAYPNNKA